MCILTNKTYSWSKRPGFKTLIHIVTREIRLQLEIEDL